MVSDFNLLEYRYLVSNDVYIQQSLTHSFNLNFAIQCSYRSLNHLLFVIIKFYESEGKIKILDRFIKLS